MAPTGASDRRDLPKPRPGFLPFGADNAGHGIRFGDAPRAASPGAKVEIWSCNGGANQQWRVNTDGTVTDMQSGLCLDVTGASIANSALVEQRICNGGSQAVVVQVNRRRVRKPAADDVGSAWRGRP
jgi:hypothetical protein